MQINGNLCLDENRRMKEGDVLRLSRESLAAPVSAEDMRIVHVDEHLVVIDKPSGVTTHRHRAGGGMVGPSQTTPGHAG